MFGKLNVGRDGAQIDGTVTAAEVHETFLDKTRPVGYDSSDARLRIEVEFPDGSKREVTCDVKRTKYLGTFLLGQVVPMRYDPKDTSRIELDLDALKAADRAKHTEAKAAAEEFFKDPPANRLEELERKRDAGLITPDEFQAESDKIFDEL